MPSWRKLVVSGSDASLNSLNINNFVSASSFVGDGSGLTNIQSSSFALTASYAENAGGGVGVGFPFSGSADITGSLTVTENLTTNNTASAGYFVGDGGGLTNISVQNLSSAILENAFDEDTNGDLMPSTSNNVLSVFYELDDNLDLMPRT